VSVQIADGVVVMAHRGAIGRIVTPADQPDGADDFADPPDSASPPDDPDTGTGHEVRGVN
jgi:hypothetical protein